MRRLLHFILFSTVIVFSGEANSQSREVDSGMSKSTEQVLLAKSKGGEDVLYSGNEFYVGSIYPNPGDEFIKFDYSIPSHITNVKFQIRNLLGNVVSSYNLNPENKAIKISTINLTPGIYFHSLYMGNRNLVTRKLIIKR